MTVAARSRADVTTGAPGRTARRCGLVERQALEQHRAVLEDGPRPAHLGRPAELAVTDAEVRALLAGEADRSRGAVVAGHRGLDAEAGEAGDQPPGQAPVHLLDPARRAPPGAASPPRR